MILTQFETNSYTLKNTLIIKKNASLKTRSTGQFCTQNTNKLTMEDYRVSLENKESIY